LPSTIETKFFKAGEFINTLCEKLGISDKVRAAALKIWENIEKLNIMKSMNAVTLAACCLNFACCLSDDNRDLEAIAVAAGITKMTLKNMYRELFPFRHYFITVDCMLRDPSELKNF
jgi:transcription initiation factor TFIIIB Brf1 subunit/transcription initiation factor TFIIB